MSKSKRKNSGEVGNSPGMFKQVGYRKIQKVAQERDCKQADERSLPGQAARLT